MLLLLLDVLKTGSIVAHERLEHIRVVHEEEPQQEFERRGEWMMASKPAGRPSSVSSMMTSSSSSSGTVKEDEDEEELLAWSCGSVLIEALWCSGSSSLFARPVAIWFGWI